MTIVGLSPLESDQVQLHVRWEQGRAYVETTLELAVSSKLDEDDFVKRKSDEIERLRDGRCCPITRISHGADAFK